MKQQEPKLGEIVCFDWGSSQVRGRVVEVYGRKDNRQVVLELNRELTG